MLPDTNPQPKPAPGKVYEKKGDGYTCQFCGQTFPAAQWNDRGQVCPNLKCAQPYNAMMEQDGEE